MGTYLCRMLGGYKLVQKGEMLGSEKNSSVSSACLALKGRDGERKGLLLRWAKPYLRIDLVLPLKHFRDFGEEKVSPFILDGVALDIRPWAHIGSLG